MPYPVLATLCVCGVYPYGVEIMLPLLDLSSTLTNFREDDQLERELLVLIAASVVHC